MRMKVKFSRNLAFILWRLHSLMFFFSFSAWPPLTYFKIDWAVIVFEHDFSFGIFKLGYTKKRPGFWRFRYFKIDWAVIVFEHDFNFVIFHLGSTKMIIFCTLLLNEGIPRAYRGKKLRLKNILFFPSKYEGITCRFWWKYLQKMNAKRPQICDEK